MGVADLKSGPLAYNGAGFGVQDLGVGPRVQGSAVGVRGSIAVCGRF